MASLGRRHSLRSLSSGRRLATPTSRTLPSCTRRRRAFEPGRIVQKTDVRLDSPTNTPAVCRQCVRAGLLTPESNVAAQLILKVELAKINGPPSVFVDRSLLRHAHLLHRGGVSSSYRSRYKAVCRRWVKQVPNAICRLATELA